MKGCGINEEHSAITRLGKRLVADVAILDGSARKDTTSADGAAEHIRKATFSIFVVDAPAGRREHLKSECKPVLASASQYRVRLCK